MWNSKLLYIVSVLLAADEFNQIICQTAGVQDIFLEQYPFHVYVENNRWGCTGILISEYFVVTAANCVNDSSKTMVYLASEILPRNINYQKKEAQEIRVGNLIVHENFSEISNIRWYNDIALLKLSTAPKVSNKIGPAIFASPEEVVKSFNMKINLTGWDVDTLNKLSITQMYIQKADLNNQRLYMKWNNPNQKVHLVGNPMSVNGKIIGFTTRGNYDMNVPIGVNISPFLDWISHKTNISVAELTGMQKQSGEVQKDALQLFKECLEKIDKNKKKNEINQKALVDSIAILSQRIERLEAKALDFDLKLITNRFERLENDVKRNDLDQKNLAGSVSNLNQAIQNTETKISHLTSESIACIETIKNDTKKNEFIQLDLRDDIIHLNQTIENTKEKILENDAKLTTKCLEHVHNAEKKYDVGQKSVINSVAILNQEIQNVKTEVVNLTKLITDINTVINMSPEAS